MVELLQFVSPDARAPTVCEARVDASPPTVCEAKVDARAPKVH